MRPSITAILMPMCGAPAARDRSRCRAGLARQIGVGVAGLILILVGAAGVVAPGAARAAPLPAAPPSGCQAPPSAGRVALWRGEGSAADSVQGLDGVLSSGAGYVPGVVGQAFGLPGDADHVRVADAAALDVTGDLTLDTWVRIDDTNFGHPNTFGVGGDRAMFSKVDSTKQHSSYGLWIGGSASDALHAPLTFLSGDRSLPGDHAFSQPLAWQAGTWYHVAVTRSGRTVAFYRDGEPVGSDTLLQDPAATPGAPLGLGAALLGHGAFDPIKGALDEPEIWNRALDPAEVKAIHDAATPLCGGAPDTTIVSGPSGRITATTATFAFTSSDPGAGFQCRVDGAAFEPCTTPYTTGPLGPGDHTFEVRAVDAGVADLTPAAQAFTIGGPGSPTAPRVTAVLSAAPIIAGRPALLSARVQGDAQRLEWDVNGDGKVDVTCGAGETTLRFRAGTAASSLRAAAFTGQVSVRAVGSAEAGLPLWQSFAVAPAPPSSAAARLIRPITALIAKEPAVYACGTARDLPAATHELTGRLSTTTAIRDYPCTGISIIAGTLHVHGCLSPVHALADIPPAERGIVQLFARAIGVSGSGHASKTIGLVNRGLDLADAFVTHGPVTVNGVELDPRGGASIVVYPQVNEILSSDAAMTVGGIRLASRTDFSLSTRPERDGVIPLGQFPRRPGGVEGLGMFPLAGDLSVALVPSVAGEPAGAQITGHLTLPSFLTVGNAAAEASVTLRVTSDGELVLQDMHIGPLNLGLAGLGVSDLRLDYTQEGNDSVWRGQGKLCVVELACLDAVEHPGETPPGGVVIRNGQLERAFVNVQFPDPGIALYPNVYLTSVGGGVGLDPTRLLGDVKVKAIGVYEIDGKLVMAFPSEAAPFHLQPGEIGGFTDTDYGNVYSRFTLAASGTASLALPVLGTSIRLGGAYFLYEAPGFVHVGGDIDSGFAGVISLKGRTSGEFNLQNGRFNFAQDIDACVADIFCRGSSTRLSSAGVGACARIRLGPIIGSISVGGGVRFDPFKIILSPWNDCAASDFEDPAVFNRAAGLQARTAQSGGPFVVQIKPGDRSRAIRLDATDGAPRVRVSAPDGQTLDSPEGAGTALSPTIRILRSVQLKATVVGLQDPKPGNYTIEPMPGSPAIAKVTEAVDPPAARATASVRGHGAHRTLVYDVLPRPNQLVTFVETGPHGTRPIGTTTGGRGTLRFRPSPGTGRRQIQAQFELNGIGAETLTIADFTPPSDHLARPRHLTVRRRGDRLLVAWSPVTHATSYEIITTLAAGGQRVTTTRHHSATITAVATDSDGVVSVLGIAPLRQGRPGTVRFRATTQRPPTRFGPLPRPPRTPAG